VWDLRDEAKKVTLLGHQRRVSSLAFSPDGKRLASSGQDGIIKLFDSSEWKEHATVKSPANENSKIAFDAEGRSLYFVGDGKLFAWDVKLDREPIELHQGPPRILSIRMSPNGRTLAAMTSENHVVLWDTSTRRERARIGGFYRRHSLFDVEFAPDGSCLALSGPAHEISLVDVRTGEVGRTLQGEMLKFLPNGDCLAVTVRELSVHLYDANTGELKSVIEGDRLVFSPDSRLAATVLFSHHIVLLEPATGRVKRTLPVHKDYPSRLVFSPDNAILLTLDGDDIVQLWDVATGNQKARVPTPYRRIHAAAFSPDSKQLVVGGDTKSLHGPADIIVLSSSPGERSATLSGHASGIYSLAFSPDGKTLASGGYDYMRTDNASLSSEG
jgi:WD40 repeat protein